HPRARDDLVEHLLSFFLFDFALCFVTRTLRRSKRIAVGLANQNVTRVNLFFRLAFFVCFGLALFELDDVETKLALDHVADLTRLQGKRSLLKLRNHVAMTKPTEIAALVFAAVS